MEGHLIYRINYRHILLFKDKLYVVRKEELAEVKVRLLTGNAIMPSRISGNITGYDLYLPEDISIAENSCKIVSLDIIIKIPESCVGVIAPKYKFSCKKFIYVLGETLDKNNEEVVQIGIFNFNQNQINIIKGTKVAELRLRKVENFSLNQGK
jgi:dUTPase